MSVLSDIWDGVRTTLAGLKVTVPYIWQKPVTTMYPHQRLELPERTRNRLYVNMDDCIGCDQCARACPVNCISIETAKAVEGDSPGVTSNGKKKALWVTRFDIDIAKCCYCGLCVFPCPTECIKMTDVFEFAEQERNNLIYNYITLAPDEVQEKIAKADEAEAALAARKAAAKAAAEKAAAEKAAAEKAAAGQAAESGSAETPLAPAASAPAIPPGTDPEKAAKIAELQAKMAAAKAKREGEGAPVAPAPSQPAASAGADADKAAKIAEIQAKMAAAKAKREAESGGDAVTSASAPVTPAPSQPAASTVPSGTDAEKAAKIAEIQAKMAAAKAKREAESGAAAPATEPAPPSAPSPSQPPPPVPPGIDPEKAAKIAELQAKMAAAKARRESGETDGKNESGA